MDHSVDRVLRSILVYCFLAGLCLLIPFGVSSGSVVLPLGLIPAFFSAIIGLVGLGNGLKRRAVAIPFDSILLFSHLAIFVPGMIKLVHDHARSNGNIILGTYGTIPLALDL